MRTTALLAAFLLAACGGTAGETPTPEAPVPEAPADSPPPTDAAMRMPGVGLPELLDAAEQGRSEDVLDRMNAPMRVEREAVENRHVAGQIDTVRTLVYAGLRVEVYDVSGGRRLIREIEVTSTDYRTREGITVGGTRAEVEAAYGPPTRAGDQLIEYELGEEASTWLRVRLEEGYVQALTWQPYVG